MPLSDVLTFLDQVRRSRSTIGAVVPSSRALGRQMAEGLPETPSRRVLEVGAGMGAFTRELVDRLGPSDLLVVVEINAAFCVALRDRIAEWTVCPGSPTVELVEGDVLQYVPTAAFDYVVSSLPFNALPEALVARIVRALHRMLTPGGTLVYFEYTGFRGVREGVRRARGVRAPSAVEAGLAPHVVRSRRVLWNVPPATVRQVQFPEPAGDEPAPEPLPTWGSAAVA